MQPKTAALLWDMVDHGEYILAKCAQSSLAAYESNRDLRLAIERAFHNIGEAARRLSRDDPNVAGKITALPTIVAFRNVLAHNYDDIDHDRVWTIITEHLPLLVQETRSLMPSVPDD